MKDVYLLRLKESDQGTFGKVLVDNFKCYSAELPWLNNRTNISRIPGNEIYKCTPYHSRKFGKVFLLHNVKGRSAILTHTGNFAGNRLKKYLQSHSWGCILFGWHYGKLRNKYGIKQQAVLSSRFAFNKFRIAVDYKPFYLHIIDSFDLGG